MVQSEAGFAAENSPVAWIWAWIWAGASAGAAPAAGCRSNQGPDNSSLDNSSLGN
jgi:hypothetical protein